jgi:carbonic anhydrase
MRSPRGWLAAALLIGFACAPPAAAAAQTPAHHPSATAAGAQQSPIDIRGDDLQVAGLHHLPPLEFHYATHARLDVENTGSPGEEATVRANVAPGAGTLRVGDRVYELVQFHWHIPAEHRMNGELYPMEMHLVHRAADSTTLVTCVFIRAGAADSNLAAVFEHFPRRSGDHVGVADFDIAALVRHDHESVRYTGSLTTPPYTEGVRWIVLTTPIELSPAEIAAFGALFPDGDSRPVQPLNARTLEADEALHRGARGDKAPIHLH